MKQPYLEELEKALDSNDPLDLVNAFHKISADEKPLSEYWIHRFCAFSEIFQKWKKTTILR